jgi:hypothetical protein
MKKMLTFSIIIGIFLLSHSLSAQTWLATKRLTWNSGGSFAPAIAVDSLDRIHLVWREETPGNAEIFYKRSTNGGATWGNTQRITWNSESSLDPAIAVDSSNYIQVVWHDRSSGNYEIYYKKSTNGGTTWVGHKRLTWNSGLSMDSAVAVDPSDNIHVVWQDYTPGIPEMYYRRSTDGGATWGNVQRLSWNSGWSFCPAITSDSNGFIHVVWHDDTPGSSEIYYKRSTNGGVSWLKTKRLTWSEVSSFRPKIAVNSSDNLHMVWYGQAPESLELFYKKGSNGGMTWGSVKRLTWNSGESSISNIAVDTADLVHVVWKDDSPGDFEIYHKKSTNGGVGWSGANRLTWTSKQSSSPKIAVDSSNSIHLVWVEYYTSGNYEIFYKKGIQ